MLRAAFLGINDILAMPATRCEFWMVLDGFSGLWMVLRWFLDVFWGKLLGLRTFPSRFA